MTRATLERPGRVTARSAAIRALDAHREFADVVSGLDLDDRAIWAAADRLVARVSTQANDVVIALTAERYSVAAPGVPPVVRVRELIAAQRRLEAAVDRWAGSERLSELTADLSDSASRVTESASRLGIVTGGRRAAPVPSRRKLRPGRRRAIGRSLAGR